MEKETENSNEINQDNNCKTENEIHSISDKSLEDKESILYKKLKDIFNEYMLTEIQSLAAFKFIREVFLKQEKETERVRKWVLNKINQSPFPKEMNKFQLGCTDLCPGISSSPFYDPKNFEFINQLIKNKEVIKEELLNLRKGENKETGFQPYKSPSNYTEIESKDGKGSLAHDSGEWNVFYLFLHELKFQSNCEKCPKTVELIEKYVPRNYK